MILTKWMAALLWSVIAGALLIYLLALLTGPGLNIQTNILRLLPADQNDPVANQAFNSFSERSLRQLLFLVESTEKRTAINAAEELAVTLENSPYIDQITLKIDNTQQVAAANFSFTYRHRLLTKNDAALLATGDYDQFTEATLAQFFSPFAGGLDNLVQTDPFLLSYRFSRANSNAAFPTLTLEDGYLLSEQPDRVYILLSARLDRSSFDPELQSEVGARISALELNWMNSGADTHLLRTGAMFYADYAFKTARSEVTLIGGSSLVLIVALITLTFFSLRPVFLVMLALGIGMGCGFSLVRWVYGEVHVLTIVFGASLIGVAVDYAFHYFSAEVRQSGPSRIQVIFPAISLGLCSSLIGYAALASTPFPGLQQMALFCIAGLCGAWLTVVLLFPLLSTRIQSSPLLLRLCKKILILSSTTAARFVFFAALIAPFIALFILITRPVIDDDVRQFQAQNESLSSQESRITEVLNTPAANQFYLVTGSTQEDLLDNLETAGQALQKMQETGIINNYLNLSDWFPSARQQQENFALYQGLYDSLALEELAAVGILSEENIDSLRQTFSQDQNLLTLEAWLDSPYGERYQELWLGQVGNSFAAVIPLRGIQISSTLKTVNNNIIFVDKIATVNQLINAYRDRAVMLLVVAILGILLLLSLRYGVKRAVAVLASPLIAIAVTLVGLHLFGETMNLFNILALFLVLGVGVDFGIFLSEARMNPEHTLLAILLSALTTMFSFGLLSLSQTPVIHSFGLTMLLGISSALLLSPIIAEFMHTEKMPYKRFNV